MLIPSHLDCPHFPIFSVGREYVFKCKERSLHNTGGIDALLKCQVFAIRLIHVGAIGAIVSGMLFRPEEYGVSSVIIDNAGFG